MFFKRKKEIVLDCYTVEASPYNYFPIAKANKFTPEWFKTLKKPTFKKEQFEEEIKNLKECYGFTNYFAKGFVLPLWSDLYLEIAPKGSDGVKWQYSDGYSSMQWHSDEATNGNFSDLEYQHLKLVSPWFFVCSEDIEFLALEPEWYFDKLDGVHILNGTMDFTVNTATNINMFAKRTDEVSKLNLMSGTPLYHFIPLTDRKVILRNHLVSQEKILNLKALNTRVSFSRHFQKKRKIYSETKCPFKLDAES